jgi:D-inositol-3-phosphate glycosyltransferase
MLELALTLRELGNEVVVVCHDFEPGTEFGNASQVLEVRAVREGATGRESSRGDTVRLLLDGMRRMARLVPLDVDVVNAHEWPALHAGAAAARRARAAFVWTRNDETLFERAVIPGETTLRPGRPMRLALGAVGLSDLRAARRADSIVVLDERNARMARTAYRRPAEIVRSGPARAFFDPPSREAARERLGIDAAAFFVFGFGILFPHRRHEDLIAAAARLRDLPGLVVHVVGSPHAAPQQAEVLGAAIKAEGVGDVVTLRATGLPEAELRDYYAAADAYVFPNERQTWGLAPLEALASGTPVVLSSGAGVHDVLAGRPGVFVVPPRSPAAIAEALRAVSGADRLAVAETRAWISKELTARSYAEQMAAIYARSS